jgi:hypothetical protein
LQADMARRTARGQWCNAASTASAVRPCWASSFPPAQGSCKRPTRRCSAPTALSPSATACRRATASTRWVRRPHGLLRHSEVLHHLIGDQRSESQERDRQVFRPDILVLEARSLIACAFEYRLRGSTEWHVGRLHCRQPHTMSGASRWTRASDPHHDQHAGRSISLESEVLHYGSLRRCAMPSSSASISFVP